MEVQLNNLEVTIYFMIPCRKCHHLLDLRLIQACFSDGCSERLETRAITFLTP